MHLVQFIIALQTVLYLCMICTYASSLNVTIHLLLIFIVNFWSFFVQIEPTKIVFKRSKIGLKNWRRCWVRTLFWLLLEINWTWIKIVTFPLKLLKGKTWIRQYSRWLQISIHFPYSSHIGKNIIANEQTSCRMECMTIDKRNFFHYRNLESWKCIKNSCSFGIPAVPNGPEWRIKPVLIFHVSPNSNGWLKFRIKCPNLKSQF